MFVPLWPWIMVLLCLNELRKIHSEVLAKSVPKPIIAVHDISAVPYHVYNASEFVCAVRTETLYAALTKPPVAWVYHWRIHEGHVRFEYSRRQRCLECPLDPLLTSVLEERHRQLDRIKIYWYSCGQRNGYERQPELLLYSGASRRTRRIVD